MPARSTLSLFRLATSQPDTGTGLPGGRAAEAKRLQAAMLAMQACRWPEAFEAFASLADEGHPLAARQALLFAQRGTRLFGGHYAATAEQRRAWARVAG
jgi:hypothetical protein